MCASYIPQQYYKIMSFQLMKLFHVFWGQKTLFSVREFQCVLMDECIFCCFLLWQVYVYEYELSVNMNVSVSMSMSVSVSECVWKWVWVWVCVKMSVYISKREREWVSMHIYDFLFYIFIYRPSYWAWQLNKSPVTRKEQNLKSESCYCLLLVLIGIWPSHHDP